MPQISGWLADYRISDLDYASDTKYFGFVDKRGWWYILKLTSTEARYAKGTSDYATNWTNRASSVVYSSFDEVF